MIANRHWALAAAWLGVLLLAGTPLLRAASTATQPASATSPSDSGVFRDLGPDPRVLLFVGSNDEVPIFDGLAGWTNVTILEHPRIPRALSFPDPFKSFRIVVWGRNALRDLKNEQITEGARQSLQRFVQRGGDLVFFEQFAMTHMEIVHDMFGVKVGGGADGAQIVDPILQDRAARAGYDEAGLKKVKFYNSYLNLPKDATVLLRGGGKKVPVGVIVPYGAGRLILIGTDMDPADKKLDQEFFDQIYHWRAAAAAREPAQAVRPDAGDPMAFPESPAEPALRRVLTPGEYERRFRAARAEIDVKLLSRPDRPTSGGLVFAVDSGSPAQKLGLKPGDIVTEIDGHPYEERIPDPPPAHRTLTFWSPDRGLRTVEIDDAPKFGFDGREGWRAAETYARSTERDPQWDEAMFVACSAYRDDPDLAETALWHARQAGYQGRLLLPLSSLIAFNQFRYDDCLAFGWQLLLNKRGLGRDLSASMYQSAILNFKLDQAVELARRDPALLGDPEPIADLARRYRALHDNSPSNPVAMLPNLTRTPWSPFSAFESDDLDISLRQVSREVANDWNKHGYFDTQIPTDHHAPVEMNPGFANLAMTLRFDLRLTDDKPSRFGKYLTLAIFEAPWILPDNSVDVILGGDRLFIRGFGLPQQQHLLALPSQSLERSRRTLRIVILHHRCEVTLDGQRIYYGPVLADEKTRKYAFFAQFAGLSGRIERPVLENLADPASPKTTNPESRP